MRTSREIKQEIKMFEEGRAIYSKMYDNYDDYVNNTGIYKGNNIIKHTSKEVILNCIEHDTKYIDMLLDELYIHQHKLISIKKYTRRFASVVLTVLKTGHIHNDVD